MGIIHSRRRDDMEDSQEGTGLEVAHHLLILLNLSILTIHHVERMIQLHIILHKIVVKELNQLDTYLLRLIYHSILTLRDLLQYQPRYSTRKVITIP